MKEITVQIAVLGGGPAGYSAALRASQLGATVALVEAGPVGGVCLNEGCIPTKALLKSSSLAAQLAHAKEYGIESRMEAIHWDSAIKRKDRIVKALRSGVSQLLHARNVTILEGKGTVLNQKEIRVEGLEDTVYLRCEKLILATGARPLLPSISGIGEKDVFTSTEALSWEMPPSQLVIIGAGVIGLEFAAMLAPLGTKVTILEQQAELLPFLDSDVIEVLLKSLKRQKIDLRLSASVTGIERTESGLSVLCNKGGEKLAFPCDAVVVAIGRKLNTESFASLSLARQEGTGALIVNESMETSLKNVYAAGDLTGNRLLAHKAYAEGIRAAEFALGRTNKIDLKTVPSCIYTMPEVAAVGLSEQEAKKQGIAIRIGSFSFRSNGRALTLGEREGFVKVLADENGVIVGGQIVGAEAAELISELSMAVSLKLHVQDIVRVIHPHPSLSEAIWEACCDLMDASIHKI